MPSSLRTLRRALYATAIGAAIIAAVASAADDEGADSLAVMQDAPAAPSTSNDDDATIDIRPPDAPRPTTRRTIRRKKQKATAPLTQKFDNFQQTYGADGELVQGSDDKEEASAPSTESSENKHEADEEDEYEEVEVEVDENGNEIVAAEAPRVPHDIPPFDQEAHDRRNREHQEMADRHHAELTAEMEVRRAEFEKRHAAHMERINTHIMGRHRERIAEHTARLSASLAAPHSRSFVPPLASASRSRSADGEAANEEEGGANGDVAAAPPAGFLGSDIEAHIQAMHEQIRRHTAEHRARIHAEMDRVHQEIRQMGASFREEGAAAFGSSSKVLEERSSSVDDGDSSV